MWETIKSIILRLFGVKPTTNNRQHEGWAQIYEDVGGINLTAIVSSKLATLAATDADIHIGGDSKRAEALQTILDKSVLDRIKKTMATALGVGGIAMVPYYAGGKLYVDYVPQDRFFIIEKTGEEITKCVILADYIVRGNSKYIRWADYSLANGTCVIRNRATRDGNPIPLDTLAEWSGIDDETHVPGANQILLGYMRCPADNRRANTDGVPITYGCDKIIDMCLEALTDEAREYNVKRAFIGVDVTMFDEDDKLPKNGLFKLFNSSRGDADLWEEYSPEIRYAAYSARVQELFGLLEKAIGTSKGILTAPDPATTATEVKFAQHDTWALVGEIRKQYEAALTQLVGALDILCNYYGISPAGEYNITFDWDMSLLEDTSATFAQLSELESRGLISGARLNAWVTGQSIEDAQKEIDEVQANQPTANAFEV